MVARVMGALALVAAPGCMNSYTLDVHPESHVAYEQRVVFEAPPVPPASPIVRAPLGHAACEDVGRVEEPRAVEPESGAPVEASVSRLRAAPTRRVARRGAAASLATPTMLHLQSAPAFLADDR